MWKCSHCNKEVDPELDVCWNCGYSDDGNPPSKEVHALLKEAKKEHKADRESERLARIQLSPGVSGFLCVRRFQKSVDGWILFRLPSSFCSAMNWLREPVTVQNGELVHR